MINNNNGGRLHREILLYLQAMKEKFGETRGKILGDRHGTLERGRVIKDFVYIYIYTTTNHTFKKIYN